MERTFIMFKPDALQRSLIGEILGRFEKKGLKIVGAKMVQLDKALCDQHYAQHKDKPFYPKLVKFVCSSPVICMALEGKDAVEVVRKMCGSTNSREAATGTIRGDYGMSVQSNLIHTSDSKEVSEKEISRFFKKEELFSYKSIQLEFLYAEDER